MSDNVSDGLQSQLLVLLRIMHCFKFQEHFPVVFSFNSIPRDFISARVMSTAFCTPQPSCVQMNVQHQRNIDFHSLHRRIPTNRTPIFNFVHLIPIRIETNVLRMTTDYWHGWAAFLMSIVMIGFLTALIGDVAAALGCTIGLKDTVTAISFVAVGTSLPGLRKPSTRSEVGAFGCLSRVQFLITYLSSRNEVRMVVDVEILISLLSKAYFFSHCHIL